MYVKVLSSLLSIKLLFLQYSLGADHWTRRDRRSSQAKILDSSFCCSSLFVAFITLRFFLKSKCQEVVEEAEEAEEAEEV